MSGEEAGFRDEPSSVNGSFASDERGQRMPGGEHAGFGDTSARRQGDAEVGRDRLADAGGPVLRLHGVTRVHGQGEGAVHALRGIDLDIAAGELVAVMGPSGSGKSTLLNLAGALDRATQGSVVIEGQDLAELTQAQVAALRRRHVGVVFQDFNLIGSLTAAENIALPLELDGASPATARGAANDALADVGIPELAERFPDEMSGGQRQRVAICRALVGPRRLVLADEPTGALDSVTGEGILELLRRRCDEGAAGMLVTHEARHAAWADRLVYLRDGLIVDSSGAPVPGEPGGTRP